MADLTTLAKVKAHGAIPADHDAILNELIPAVSRALEKEMLRTIEQVLAVVRTYRSPGLSVIVLREWPVDNLVVTEDGGALVEGTDYEIRDDRRMVRISGNLDIAWGAGAKVSVTADEGYATIPEDIDLAAQAAVRIEFFQTEPGGNRLGAEGVTSSSGSQEDIASGWSPFIKSVVAHNKRPLF